MKKKLCGPVQNCTASYDELAIRLIIKRSHDWKQLTDWTLIAATPPNRKLRNKQEGTRVEDWDQGQRDSQHIKERRRCWRGIQAWEEREISSTNNDNNFTEIQVNKSTTTSSVNDRQTRQKLARLLWQNSTNRRRFWFTGDDLNCGKMVATTASNWPFRSTRSKSPLYMTKRRRRIYHNDDDEEMTKLSRYR